jgi:lipoprotein-anchoring transpeptidase ErfK/SrfK
VPCSPLQSVIRPTSATRFLSVVAALVAMLLGVAGALASPASAANGVPDAPVISTVVGGTASGQLVVNYTPPPSDGGAPITGYEVSLDSGTTWFLCSGAVGVCPLLNLVNGRPYTVVLRATSASGPGQTSAPASGTPSLPVGADPDKPVTLPTPRVRVGATFNAASNSLGVDGTTTKLGVGTLPKLRFTRAIPDKAAVERHLAVTATSNVTGVTSAVRGSWGWVDDRSAIFRPAKFWPGNSTITITSSLDGVVMGQSGAQYVVGAKSLGTSYVFQTARSLIARVDGATRLMKVYIDGDRVHTFPISLGKSGWETRNGVKVVSTDKEPKHTYTSVALNIDTNVEEPYELKDIPWNTRLTPTGEFMHAAPWALSRLGRWNGSHGCTNMRPDDAKWIYDVTIPGDVVLYTNTGGATVEPGNGPGGLWNIPSTQWLAKSALVSVTGSVDATKITGPSSTLPAATA